MRESNHIDTLTAISPYKWRWIFFFSLFNRIIVYIHIVQETFRKMTPQNRLRLSVTALLLVCFTTNYFEYCHFTIFSVNVSSFSQFTKRMHFFHFFLFFLYIIVLDYIIFMAIFFFSLQPLLFFSFVPTFNRADWSPPKKKNKKTIE